MLTSPTRVACVCGKQNHGSPLCVCVRLCSPNALWTVVLQPSDWGDWGVDVCTRCGNAEPIHWGCVDRTIDPLNVFKDLLLLSGLKDDKPSLSFFPISTLPFLSVSPSLLSPLSSLPLSSFFPPSFSLRLMPGVCARSDAHSQVDGRTGETRQRSSPPLLLQRLQSRSPQGKETLHHLTVVHRPLPVGWRKWVCLSTELSFYSPSL